MIGCAFAAGSIFLPESVWFGRDRHERRWSGKVAPLCRHLRQITHAALLAAIQVGTRRRIVRKVIALERSMSDHRKS